MHGIAQNTVNANDETVSTIARNLKQQDRLSGLQIKRIFLNSLRVEINGIYKSLALTKVYSIPHLVKTSWNHEQVHPWSSIKVSVHAKWGKNIVYA